jgi:hypothetical protein
MKAKLNQAEVIQSVLASDSITSSSIELYELVGAKMSFVRYVKGGVNCCIAFKNKSTKKAFHYSFSSVQNMEAYIDDKKKSLKSDSDSFVRWKTQGEEQNKLIQEGSILYSSWGCEQTNIDFYLIIERKGDFVKLVEIGQNSIVNGFMSGECTPNKDEIVGEVMRKKITNGAISFASYKSAWLYDGKPKYWSSYA